MNRIIIFEDDLYHDLTRRLLRDEKQKPVAKPGGTK